MELRDNQRFHLVLASLFEPPFVCVPPIFSEKEGRVLHSLLKLCSSIYKMDPDSPDYPLRTAPTTVVQEMQQILAALKKASQRGSILDDHSWVRKLYSVSLVGNMV